MKYIRLFLDYLDAIEPLGDAERGRLFTALLVYAGTGEAPRLSGNERFLFPMMRAQVDRDEADANGLSEARRAAGKLGAKAKASKSKQSRQLPALPSKTSKEDDKDNNKDNDKYEDAFPAPARVSIPTLEQVEEAAGRCQCLHMAKPFFDYYAAAGWRDSEGKPVYSWQQKLQAWKMREERQERRQRPQAASGRTWTELAEELDREEGLP